MPYDKAVDIENLKENAEEVLRSIDDLSREDAMNALGAAISHVVIKNWPSEVRVTLLDGWYGMVRSSLSIGD